MKHSLLWLVLLPGCDIFTVPATDAGTDDTGTTPPGTTVYDALSFSEEELRSDGDGRYVVKVDVPAGATSFQVTSTSPQLPALESVTDPDGNEILDWQDLIQSPRSLTNAIYPQRTDVAFNWPIREVDGALKPGKYKVEWALVDDSFNYVADGKVTASTVIKRDPDFSQGEVHVRIVYAEGIDQLPKVTNAVEAAVEHWREVWGSVGVTLVERYDTSDLDASLDFTWSGDPSVKKIADTKEPGELQLIVGETVRGEQYIYGVSAGIPGTIEPTKNTFVVLAWTTHAGPDGNFSDNDIMVMGETMAHETGHYMGLFHPVEGTWNNWDALDDTVECNGQLQCNRDLGENLMYPYSLCGGSTCRSQYILTDDQGGVFQRAVGSL
ncbi:MAG: hypothetical protein H6738_22805 [Alphaproteobacteria bacterium]|nr:hypothetical protein [Alphaproteobacteria bacterium]MCB9699633.1 hypothetical protein [Alphaproteobacteria bacterium]